MPDSKNLQGQKLANEPVMGSPSEVMRSTVSAIIQLISSLKDVRVASEDLLKYRTKNNIGIPESLDLAYNAAILIKSHTTKLSLLIINKPFTPTAVTTVLKELIVGPLPTIASAVQMCQISGCPKSMSSELAFSVSRVFFELEVFVKALPLDGEILSQDEQQGTGDTKGKGSLANTGTLWQACEAVMELKKMGIAGLCHKKVDEYRDLLKDALEELKEWGDEEADEEDDDDADSEEGSLRMFGSQPIPASDPEKIRPRLEHTKKKLTLIKTLYGAIVKRRVVTLGAVVYNEAWTPRIDEMLELLGHIPDNVDELAGAFYDLSPGLIDRLMDDTFTEAIAVTNVLSKNWQGKDDEFTAWTSKFSTSMREPWEGMAFVKVDTKADELAKEAPATLSQ